MRPRPWRRTPGCRAALVAAAAAAAAAALAGGLAVPFVLAQRLGATWAPASRSGGGTRGSLRRAAAGAGGVHEDVHLDRLEGLAREGRAEEAEDALYDMIDSGASPGPQHYAAMIDSCAPGRDFSRAERWLFRMQAMEVTPDLGTYQALLRVALEARDTSGAERWFGEAQINGLVPDLATFVLLLQTLGRTGSSDLVEIWFEKMMDAGVKPNMASVNAVLRAYAEKKDTSKLVEWLAVAESSLGLVPEVETYNTIIEGYCKAGNIKGAEEMAQRMSTKGLQPNARTYALLIGDGRSNRKLSTISLWSDRLRGSGLPIDGDTYTAVIGAWASVGDDQSAEDWFASMFDSGLPTAEALALVVDAMMLSGSGEALETAQEWVDQVRQLGVKLTPGVYAALASADVYRGDFEQVEARLQQMQVDGFEMNADALTALLLSYANAEPQQCQLAEQVFKEQMLSGKVVATREVLEALRAAVGGARCLFLRRDLELTTARFAAIGNSAKPGIAPPSAGRRKSSTRKPWSAWTVPVVERQLAWE